MGTCLATTDMSTNIRVVRGLLSFHQKKDPSQSPIATMSIPTSQNKTISITYSFEESHESAYSNGKRCNSEHKNEADNPLSIDGLKDDSITGNDDDSLEDLIEFDEGQIVAGKYQITSFIGHGDIGTTYFALNLTNNIRCALKNISFIQREHLVPLVRENQRLVTRLQHDNVLPVFDVMEDSTHSNMIVVTAAAQKGNIFHYAGKLEDNPDLLQKIAHDIGVGFRVLHSHQIYHHNIKLENILETKTFNFSIADAGFCRLLADCPIETLIEMSQVALIPPEMFTTERSQINPGKIDMWGFGVVLYQLAFGLNPFRPVGTVEEVRDIITNTPLPIFRNTKISPDFLEIVRWLMEKDPQQRPSIMKLLRHPYFRCNTNQSFFRSTTSYGSMMAGRSFGSMSNLKMSGHNSHHKDNGFIIDFVIGKGYHGESFLVHLPTNKRQFAFKALELLFSDRLMKYGKTTEDQFIRRHIAIDRKIKHPNVTSYLEFVDSKLSSVTQRYFPRGNIAVNFPTLDGDHVVVLMLTDVLRGLAALHENETYHCNIKPSNVFYGEDGNFVITDFGPIMFFPQEVKDDPSGCIFAVSQEIKDMLKEANNDSDLIEALQAVDTFSVGLLAAAVIPEFRNVFESFYRLPEAPKLDVDKLVSQIKNIQMDFPPHYISFIETALQACPTVQQLLKHPLFVSDMPQLITQLDITEKDLKAAIKPKFDLAEEHRIQDLFGCTAFVPLTPHAQGLEVSAPYSSINFDKSQMSLRLMQLSVFPATLSTVNDDFLSSSVGGCIEYTFHRQLQCQICKVELKLVIYFNAEKQHVRCGKCKSIPPVVELITLVILAVRGFADDEEDKMVAVLGPPNIISQHALDEIEMQADLPAGALSGIVKERGGTSTVHLKKNLSSPTALSGSNHEKGQLLKETDLDDMTAEDVIAKTRKENSQELPLHSMGLKVVPEEIFDVRLCNIIILDLSSNELTSIPDAISCLAQLKHMRLSHNKLTSLPNSIGDLSELEFLDLAHNELTALPPEIMFCDQLDQIVLDYNSFSEIPDCIFDMPQLTSILMAENSITKWPPVQQLRAFSIDKGEFKFALDNEPNLWAEYQEIQSEIRRVSVMWNKIYPDQIIPDLYCGSLRSAQSLAVYERLNIRYLLTMGRGLEPHVPEWMKHRTVIVDDIEGATIDNSFEEAAEFIDESLKSGVGCLVHCFAGMSRSATAVIAYLMIKRHMRLDDAYLLTKKGRPAIYPNTGFFTQLLKLDAVLYPADQRPLNLSPLERDKIPT